MPLTALDIKTGAIRQKSDQKSSEQQGAGCNSMKSAAQKIIETSRKAWGVEWR